MEEDIKILRTFLQDRMAVYNEDLDKHLENILNRLEQDERVIEEMAKALKSYANLGVLIKCPAEYDGRYNFENCKIDIFKNRTDKTNKICNKCIIEHFRKKCE